MLCFARVFLKCLSQVSLLNGESRRSNARAPRAQRRRLLGQSGDDEAYGHGEEVACCASPEFFSNACHR